MKKYNWSNIIIYSLLAIITILKNFYDLELIYDISLILCCIYIIITGIRYLISRKNGKTESSDESKLRQEKIINRYGKKVRIIQLAPSVLFILALTILIFFKNQPWSVMTLIIIFTLFIILLLIKTILEYPFSE